MNSESPRGALPNARISRILRLGEDFHDQADIALLVRKLGLGRVIEAEATLSRDYPLEKYPVRALLRT
jgi:hypothetical protein